MSLTPDGFWVAPQVTVLSRPAFTEPAHLPVRWNTPTTDGEQIIEFAGRLCYMSQSNPANRTTAGYIKHIMDQNHGSVLEHANYGVLIEGVSRSLTHELIRHRAGMAYSQLSQRYVDERDCTFVIPPAFLNHPEILEQWKHARIQERVDYVGLGETLMARYSFIEGTTHRRKVVRESSRSMLSNATETKIVVTGNMRSWRHVILLRGNEGADAEIRRLAVALLTVLQPECPTVLGDLRGYIAADGFPAVCIQPVE